MKRTICTVVMLSLVGCVKTRQQLRAEDGTSDMELRKQTASQQAPPPYKEKAPPTGYRFEEMDDQIRNLNGRLDTVENRLGQMDAASAGEKQSVTAMATAIDAKFLAYEEEIKKLKAQVQELVDNQKKPSAAAPAPAKGKSAYDEGEELFNKKQWKEAIVEYQKYRDGNPRGKLYADATYKIGVCFAELRMKDEAKAFFEEVIAKSPNSKEAKKAAFRMKTLK